MEDVLSCRHGVVTSTITADEIKDKFPYFQENASGLFVKLQAVGKLHLLPHNEQIVNSAVVMDKKLKLGWKDCLHIILAKNCDYLVTLDQRMFNSGKELVKTAFPQDLLLF